MRSTDSQIRAEQGASILRLIKAVRFRSRAAEALLRLGAEAPPAPRRDLHGRARHGRQACGGPAKLSSFISATGLTRRSKTNPARHPPTIVRDEELRRLLEQ